MKTSQFRLPRISKGWVPCGPSPFLLFTQDYFPEHSHSNTNLILLIASTIPCSLHFAFSLFVWLIKLKCTPHPSHYMTVSGYMKYWEAKREDPGAPKYWGESKLEGKPDLKEGTSEPSSYHANVWSDLILL